MAAADDGLAAQELGTAPALCSAGAGTRASGLQSTIPSEPAGAADMGTFLP